MLLTDGYGCLGGIAQYNRDFLRALADSPRVESIVAWPRRISRPIEGEIPEAVIYERRFARGKFQYALGAFADLCSSRSCDLVVCAHLHLLPIAWLLAKRRRAALALTIYGVEAWRPTNNVVTNFLARRLDRLISISRHTEQKFTEWAAANANTHIIPPCVDLERFRPGEKPAYLLDRYGLAQRRVLMSLGRMEAGERYKGVDEILDLTPRLAARFPDFAYLVVGGGDDRARLEEKAARLGVGAHVVFTGEVSDAAKPAHYLLADLFAMPSMGEGFGIVLIEAAACGVPVLGGALDGSREALLDGALGVLVDPRCADSLYAALESALAAPAAPRRKNGVEHYSWDAFRTRVADWLETVVRK